MRVTHTLPILVESPTGNYVIQLYKEFETIDGWKKRISKGLNHIRGCYSVYTDLAVT